MNEERYFIKREYGAFLNANYLPSDQTVLFAKEALYNIRDLKQDFPDLEMSELLEAYKIGLMAQQTDFMHSIAISLDSLAEDLEKINDKGRFADSIYWLSEHFCKRHSKYENNNNGQITERTGD